MAVAADREMIDPKETPTPACTDNVYIMHIKNISCIYVLHAIQHSTKITYVRQQVYLEQNKNKRGRRGKR